MGFIGRISDILPVRGLVLQEFGVSGFQARVGLLGDELTIGGLVIGLTVRGSVMNS